MTVKSFTKDGKVPLGIRLEPYQYDILRKYAYENNVTPNQAILQIVFRCLGEGQEQSGKSLD